MSAQDFADLEPLEPGLASLLENERARPGMPRDVEAALLRRLEASLGLPPAPASPAPAAPAAKPGAPAAPASPPGSWTLASGKGVAVLVATFLAGGGAGAAALRAASAPPSPAVTEVHTVVVERDRPSAPTAASSIGAPAPALDPNALPDAPSSSAAGRRASERSVASADAPASSAESDEDLAEERSLIDTARAAIGRGNAAGALEKLEEHARRFPRGRLTEEREALWVMALSGAARDARAAAFHERFPKSLLLPQAPLPRHGPASSAPSSAP
ncbi:MAG TPA: hypothetical protein VHB21_01045 [Minicystis sp.]|nr:hypothetical protein [Minicystis sp.]